MDAPPAEGDARDGDGSQAGPRADRTDVEGAVVVEELLPAVRTMRVAARRLDGSEVEVSRVEQWEEVLGEVIGTVGPAETGAAASWKSDYGEGFKRKRAARGKAVAGETVPVEAPLVPDGGRQGAFLPLDFGDVERARLTQGEDAIDLRGSVDGYLLRREQVCQ